MNYLKLYILQNIKKFIKMEEVNHVDVIISQFEKKITNIVEGKIIYRDSNRLLLPLSISNDNNKKCRDIDVNIAFITSKHKEKKMGKISKIIPVNDKEFDKNFDNNLICDMV